MDRLSIPTETAGELRGVTYRVESHGSLSHLFPVEEGRRGIYRLHFSDGDMYVGQSTNVVKRLSAHRRRWEDISGVDFFPVPVGDLDRVERALIDFTSGQRSVRNLRHTETPGGSATLHLTIKEGQTVDIPWERDKRVQPSESAVSGPRARFQELASRSVYSEVREVLGWYVREVIPDPINTHGQLWVLSCLPGTGKQPGIRRLATLSCGGLETLVVYENLGGVHAFINTAALPRPANEYSAGAVSVERAVYRLREVYRWHGAVVELPHAEHLDTLLTAAYRLNASLMRQGVSLFRRHHNPVFAVDVVNHALTPPSNIP